MITKKGGKLTRLGEWGARLGESMSADKNKKGWNQISPNIFISNFFSLYCARISLALLLQNSPNLPSFDKSFIFHSPLHLIQVFHFYLIFAFSLALFDVFVVFISMICKLILCMNELIKCSNLWLFWIILGLFFTFYMFFLSCSLFILHLYMLKHVHATMKCHNGYSMCYFEFLLNNNLYTCLAIILGVWST